MASSQSCPKGNLGTVEAKVKLQKPHGSFPTLSCWTVRFSDLKAEVFRWRKTHSCVAAASHVKKRIPFSEMEIQHVAAPCKNIWKHWNMDRLPVWSHPSARIGLPIDDLHRVAYRLGILENFNESTTSLPVANNLNCSIFWWGHSWTMWNFHQKKMRCLGVPSGFVKRDAYANPTGFAPTACEPDQLVAPELCRRYWIPVLVYNDFLQCPSLDIIGLRNIIHTKQMNILKYVYSILTLYVLQCFTFLRYTM